MVTKTHIILQLNRGVFLEKAPRLFLLYLQLHLKNISKALREEYAEVLEAKRKAYAEYKQVREEMRELQNVKANIDYLLGPSVEKKQIIEHS